MILLQPTYLAPIIQYATIANTSNFIFEVEDNYQKQTYRNRCYIFGPNGKQLLNIPTKHQSKTGKIKTKDILIDNESSNWQQTHIRSFQAAYSSSPFYEYYEDDLCAIYSKKHHYLLDLNLELHQFVMEALQESSQYEVTTSFEKKTQYTDFRSLSNAKKNIALDFPEYQQMFSQKYGFLPNLSILDLLVMEGPASYSILKKTQNTVLNSL